MYMHSQLNGCQAPLSSSLVLPWTRAVHERARGKMGAYACDKAPAALRKMRSGSYACEGAQYRTDGCTTSRRLFWGFGPVCGTAVENRTGQKSSQGGIAKKQRGMCARGQRLNKLKKIITISFAMHLGPQARAPKFFVRQNNAHWLLSSPPHPPARLSIFLFSLHFLAARLLQKPWSEGRGKNILMYERYGHVHAAGDPSFVQYACMPKSMGHFSAPPQSGPEPLHNASSARQNGM